MLFQKVARDDLPNGAFQAVESGELVVQFTDLAVLAQNCTVVDITTGQVVDVLADSLRSWFRSAAPHSRTFKFIFSEPAVFCGNYAVISGAQAPRAAVLPVAVPQMPDLTFTAVECADALIYSQTPLLPRTCGDPVATASAVYELVDADNYISLGGGGNGNLVRLTSRTAFGDASSAATTVPLPTLVFEFTFAGRTYRSLDFANRLFARRAWAIDFVVQRGYEDRLLDLGLRVLCSGGTANPLEWPRAYGTAYNAFVETAFTFGRSASSGLSATVDVGSSSLGGEA